MVVGRRADLGEAGFRHYLRIHVQQRQEQAALAAAAAARAQAEAAENAAAWTLLRARLPASRVEQPLHLLLPSGPRHARRLAIVRRSRYRDYLQDIVAEAAAGAPQGGELATPAATSSMPGQLCGLCGGGCCTRGGDHAYLNASSVRRFMDAQPQMSREDVVAAYIDRIPPATQSGSCINHTRDGCSLPREMRSDTCNRYACESLARLQAAQREENAVQVVLVVRRKQDQWLRTDPRLDNTVTGGGVLRESGTTRIPAASLRPSAAAP
jgi:hypothetical protein